MQDLRDSWLNNGKLRASYGVIGNQNGIGRYQTYRTWGYSTTYQTTNNGTGRPTGDSYKLSMGGLVNTQLTWEETKTFDVGLDLTLFNRIDLTFDWYNRVTGNSQFSQPVSYLAMGQTTLPRNIAELTNRGIELDINADIIRTKDIRWNVAFNITHYTTKLTDLPDDAIPAHAEGLPDGTWEDNQGSWASAGGSQQNANVYLRGIGRDWFNLYMYKYAGIDQSSGLPMYFHRVTEADHAAGKYKDTDQTEVRSTEKALVGEAPIAAIGGSTAEIRVLSGRVPLHREAGSRVVRCPGVTLHILGDKHHPIHLGVNHIIEVLRIYFGLQCLQVASQQASHRQGRKQHQGVRFF